LSFDAVGADAPTVVADRFIQVGTTRS